MRRRQPGLSGPRPLRYHFELGAERSLMRLQRDQADDGRTEILHDIRAEAC